MTRTKSISDKTLDAITKRKIEPIPQWEFVAKNRVWWIMFVASILIGGLGFSIVLWMLTSTDWDLYRIGQKTPAQFIVLNLPYFWLITTIGFAVFAYIFFRKTKKAYRWDWGKVVAGEVIVSVVIGTAMFGLGIGSKVDELFARDIPFYRTMVPHMLNNWMNPEEGLLAGEIKDIRNKLILLEDFNGKKWTVELDNPVVRGGLELEGGSQIKIIGEKINDNSFRATEIRPWIGRGMMRRLE